jgi:hypothetical protein
MNSQIVVQSTNNVFVANPMGFFSRLFCRFFYGPAHLKALDKSYTIIQQTDTIVDPLTGKIRTMKTQMNYDMYQYATFWGEAYKEW